MPGQTHQLFSDIGKLSKTRPLIFSILITVIYVLVLGLVTNIVFKGFPEYTMAFLTSTVSWLVMLVLCLALFGRGSLQGDPTRKFSLGFRLSWPILIPIAFSLVFRILPASSAGLVSNWKTVLIFSILGGFAVALVEEFVFRKLILGSISKSGMTAQGALVMSAAVFGLFHLVNLTVTPEAPISVVVQIIYAFLMGLLFGALYLRTQNIFVPIVAHGIIDAVSLAADIFVQPQAAAAGDVSIVSAIIMIASTIPAALAGISYMKKYTKK